MENRKFTITRKSKVKPLYITQIDTIGDDILFKRKYQSHVFVLYHAITECYITIHYSGLDTFNYERLIEFIIDLKPKLNMALN